uniref:Vomeronasal type-1 receptor n=1 Tax=Acrobeloides nanus TaxID=290746 RepID=A0A914D8H0_9BILA
MNRFLGLIKVGFMWVVMFVWNVFAFDNEDLYQVKPYCVLTSPNNNEKLKSMNYILLVLDILVTIMDFLLFLKNSKSLTSSRRFNQVTPSYQLSQVYQLNENKRAMQMIFPMSVLHSLFFIAYLVTSLVVREMFFNSEDQVQYKSLIELTNVITCVYITLVPLIFLGLRKNLTKPKPTRIVPLIDEQGLYMNNLKNMWN